MLCNSVTCDVCGLVTTPASVQALEEMRALTQTPFDQDTMAQLARFSTRSAKSSTLFLGLNRTKASK